MEMHKKHAKSLLAFVLAVLMLLSACPLSGFIGLIAAAEDKREGAPAFGGAYWDYFEDGEIRFNSNILPQSPTGPVIWKDPAGMDVTDYIKTITITKGVTAIGAYGFKDLKVTVVYIPDSVRNPGVIDADAFAGSQIKTVFYEGSLTMWKAAFAGYGTVSGIVVNFNHVHNTDQTKHPIDATCTKEGYKGDLYCTVCGAFNKRGEDAPKAPHEWSKEYAIIDGEEPTCNKSGYKATYCLTCGTFNHATRTEVPPTGEHNWEYDVIANKDKLDDCADHAGEQVILKCADCGISSTDDRFAQRTFWWLNDNGEIEDSKQDDWNKLSEKQQGRAVNSEENRELAETIAEAYAKANAKNKDEEKALKEKRRGEVLENLKKIENDNTDARYNQKVWKAATVLANHSNALGEDHLIYDTTDEATCTKAGKTIITCEWCNYRKEQVVEAKGHSNVATGTTTPYLIPATCTEPGERGTRCTVCGETLSTEVVPTNHTEGYRSGTWVTQREPDCVNKGYQWLKCNYCGQYIEEVKIGEDGKPVLDGQGAPIMVYVQKDIAPTPELHTPSRWFKTKEPRCTENGEKIQICTVKGCPYFSDTSIGRYVVKISDRKALDQIIAVTKDLSKDHYHYAPTRITGSSSADGNNEIFIDPVPSNDRVYDVADEVNMAIMEAFKRAEDSDFNEDGTLDEKSDIYAELKDRIVAIFTTAVDHHGFLDTDKNGKEKFFYDKFFYGSNELKDGAAHPGYDCVGEQTYTVPDDLTTIDPTQEEVYRYVFSEIAAEAAELLIAHDSVINTTDDVVAILEQAWEALGDAEIGEKMSDPANKAEIGKLTNKALAKQVIAETGHDWIRCYDIEHPGKEEFGYVVINNEFVPVCRKSSEREGVDYSAWYRVDHYDDNGKPVAGEKDEDYMGTKAVTHVNCIEGDGNMIWQCRTCMKLKDPTLVRQGSHDMQTSRIAPTCTSNGYKHEYCTKCDYFVDVETDTPLIHNYVDTTIKTSTCSKAGIKVKICEYCGDVDKSTYQTLALLPHTDVALHEDATCTETGRDGWVCEVCGRFDGEVLPALQHNYVEKVTEPTCVDYGFTTATCSRCGDLKAPYNFIPAKGHQFSKAKNIDATCTFGSYTKRICLECGFVEMTNVRNNARAHDLVTEDRVPATCTEPGHEKWVHCRNCKETDENGYKDAKYYYKEIPATGHTAHELGYVAATCTKDGHEPYTECAVCHAALTPKVVLKATGHDWKNVAKLEPTCTEDGHSAYKQCKNCGECDDGKLPDDHKIDKLGHDFHGHYVVTERAKLFKAGTIKWTCSRCDGTDTQSYEMTLGQKLRYFFLYLFVITDIVKIDPDPSVLKY